MRGSHKQKNNVGFIHKVCHQIGYITVCMLTNTRNYIKGVVQLGTISFIIIINQFNPDITYIFRFIEVFNES